VIPAQTARDFLYRDAANEHLAQRAHLRIRPLSAGIHGQRSVICLGSPRIEDRGPYQAQQRFVLGISRAAEECGDFN
jgi:hypothetical protein